MKKGGMGNAVKKEGGGPEDPELRKSRKKGEVDLRGKLLQGIGGRGRKGKGDSLNSGGQSGVRKGVLGRGNRVGKY